MACAFDSDTQNSSESESEDDIGLNSDSSSDGSNGSDSDSGKVSDNSNRSSAFEMRQLKVHLVEPCRFYNSGGCKKGSSCNYLHVCKFALKGNCRNGSRCSLNHPEDGSRRSSYQTPPSASKLTDGRRYQWQLKNGSGWKNIDNDHVIEAQYSLPHTKSIKMYNTQYGAVSVDFNKMKVYGKDLRVRRLDDGNTVWNWYCIMRHKWIKYGTKGLRGNVTSSDIEKKFQRNPTGSFTFDIGAKNFEIDFKAMQQTGQKKRKVTRRPVYREKKAGSGASGFSTLRQEAEWEFEGNRGAWYKFKHRTNTPTECSITSADIEKKYQQNPCNSMQFQVSGNSHKLDLGAMIQTNLRTGKTRRIRRVVV
ncbi:protein mono-ADP-ribosyltransferase PARP12 [Brachyistius frenatus]|uniref:protein mono-ADP-ribosyltransferase PARP12 n=1 Tax=Brachyistius frenatus TaxID=100188 RepID=UPI0037E91441